MTETSAQHYELVPLADRSDLTPACIDLLNQEWPRSDTQRQRSLQRTSTTEPPMSLILLDKRDGSLAGHARLCTMPPDATFCWIESVIVQRNLRGSGLGRMLMELLEAEARKWNFKKVYLSTEDKSAFYEKCGYEFCEPVLNVGANKQLFTDPKLERFLARSTTDSQDSTREDPMQQQSAPTERATSCANPPPPPPPLPLAKPTKEQTTKKKDYMCKILQE